MIADGSRPAAFASSSMRRLASCREFGEPQACHTSAYRATSGNVRRGPLPPIQIGGCGCCTGAGRSCAFSNDTTLPSYDTTSPVDKRVNDFERVLEQVEAGRRRRERNAELVVLLVEPRRAERQLEAAVRCVVDGESLRGEDRRVPVGHAGHEQAEPDTRRHAGERGKRRHAVERLTGPVAVHRLEVIEAPHTVEAELFGELSSADHLVPRQPLLRDIESKTHLRKLAARSRRVAARLCSLPIVHGIVATTWSRRVALRHIVLASHAHRLTGRVATYVGHAGAMPDDSPARNVVVLAPMPLEMHAIVKAFGVQPTTSDQLDPWRGRLGRSEVKVVHIGMGPPLTRAALQRLFDESTRGGDPIDHVMNAGICGGLDPAIDVGTIINPEIIVDNASGTEFRHRPPTDEPRAASS